MINQEARGNIDSEDVNDYLLYLNDEERPRAIYMAPRGEYEAFLDVERGILGSPLADIDGPLTWEEWEKQWSHIFDETDDPELRGQKIEIRLCSPYIKDPETGLSIYEVQKAAFAHVVDWVFDKYYGPETDLQNKLFPVLFGMI